MSGGQVLVSGTLVKVDGNIATVTGSLVNVGGTSGCAPAARVGDVVTGDAPDLAGPILGGEIATGSSTTLIC
jgi:hypothetical protein